MVYKKQSKIPDHIKGFETIKITEKDITNRPKLKKRLQIQKGVSPYLEGSEATRTMYGDTFAKDQEDLRKYEA